MPKTRHTLWIDAKELRGHDRYTVRNPRFRVWMMIIAILVVAVALVLMFVLMPGTGKLSVHFSSIPDGAGVFIDGEDVGVTPCDVRLEHGSYVMRMETDGYLPVSESIEVTDSNRSFSVVFAEGKAEIAFTSNPEDVRVYLDSQYIGKTPFVYCDTVEDEPVTIKAEKTGYYAISRIENLFGVDEFNIKLEQIMLNVQINSEPPSAELFIDSRHVGTTPWSSMLYFGKHHIRIAKEGGYRIIEETIDVKSDLEVTYPLESQGIAIYGIVGDTHTPGASVYVAPVIAGEVMANASPWAVEQTTPIQLLAEDMAVYLTHKETVPDRALIIGKRSESSASAGIRVVDINSIGEIEESEISILFPDKTQVDFLGQSIEGISWFSLLSETLSPAGLIENNPRYTLIGGKVVDRDDPTRSFNTEGRRGEMIISPVQEHLAVIGGGTVNVYDRNGFVTATDGVTAVFGDNAVFVASGDEVRMVNLTTATIQSLEIGIKPQSLQLTSGFLLAQSDDGDTVVIDTESMNRTSWQRLLTGAYPDLADHFIPEGMFSRNVAGDDHVLLLGKVYGLKVLFGLGESPSLLNVWFDETPLRLEEALTGQGT